MWMTFWYCIYLLWCVCVRNPSSFHSTRRMHLRIPCTRASFLFLSLASVSAGARQPRRLNEFLYSRKSARRKRLDELKEGGIATILDLFERHNTIEKEPMLDMDLRN